MRFKRYILLIGLVLCYEANASSNTLLCGVNQEKMFHQLISDTEPEYRHLYQEHIIKLVESAYKGDIESLFDLAESLAHISEDYEKSKCFFEMISERKDDYATFPDLPI